jgi:DNA-binding response OmpR family regulator
MATKNTNTTVLVADDDELNLEILQKNLTREGFSSTLSHDGQEAWDILSANPENFSIVLLDKMMPKMSGMEVLSRMKMHPILRYTPVIIQTGDVGSKEVTEGLSAGAYYYLTKPFDPDMMMAVVNSAIKNFQRQETTSRNTINDKSIFGLLSDGKFIVKDSKDAMNIATAIASLAVDSDKVGIAILELIINAIEHGNLCIGYDLKKTLSINGMMENEIEKRLQSPEHSEKRVYISLQKSKDEVAVTICDEGQGFNWREFKEFDPVRLMEPNGRSIAIINNLLEVKVQYHEPGNKVVCKFKSK